MTKDAQNGDLPGSAPAAPIEPRAIPIEHKVLKRSGEGASPSRGTSARKRVRTTASPPVQPPHRAGVPAALAACGAIVIWTVFFFLAHGSRMSGASAPEWSMWIAQWAVPVVLAIGVWLLFAGRRQSAGERFPDEVGTMSEVASELEHRLVRINRELAQARESLSTHSGDLEGFGRSAISSISASADRLERLVVERGDQLENIARTSAVAVSDVERLQERLPAIMDAASALSRQITETGTDATARFADMAGGFEQMEQASAKSGQGIVALRALIDEQLGGLTGKAGIIDNAAKGRLDELRRQADVFDQELNTREEDNFAAIRRRAALLQKELSEQDIALLTRAGDALDELRAKMSQVREEGIRLADTVETDQGSAMRILERSLDGVEGRMREAVERVAGVEKATSNDARSRLASLREEAEHIGTVTAEHLRGFEDETATRRAAQLAHLSGLAEKGEALAARMAEIDQQFATLSHRSEGTSGRLSEAAEGLEVKLSTSRDLLAESGAAIERLTGSSTRLLELMQANRDQTGPDLVRAVTAAEGTLASFEERTLKLHDALGEARDRGAALATSVEQARSGSAQSVQALESLDRRLTDLSDRSALLAETTREDLEGAIAALESAADTMIGKFRKDQEDALRDLADTIGSRSQDAITAALRDSGERVIARIEQSAREATQAGRNSVEQLLEQIAEVDDMAGNMEARVAQARAQAETEVDNDFSREMAQIVDALQSRAVDVTRAFSTEVSDEDWQAYIQGDRGRFARRAVRLLNAEQAKAVRASYQGDKALRKTIDSYIKDFESMLRVILATRQGHAIAVTLLSSDIGKLYVSLAQAIARLQD